MIADQQARRVPSADEITHGVGVVWWGWVPNAGWDYSGLYN
jgi:hypothetical protein